MSRDGLRRPRRIREDRTTIDLDGRAVPLRLRRNPRARRIILRVDGDGNGAVLTLPARVPVDEGLDMVRRQSGWLLRRLESLPPRVPFADGALVPYLGVDHVVRHDPARRGVVQRADGVLAVSGRAEHAGRRLADWLKAEARRELATRARDKAARLDKPVGRVSVRDTRGRWGSCSAAGNLSFCWRLILAPEFVLDYVVAHEVAHLAVKDHSARFWKTVAGLTAEVPRARAWLRRNGESLHRFG